MTTPNTTNVNPVPGKWISYMSVMGKEMGPSASEDVNWDRTITDNPHFTVDQYVIVSPPRSTDKKHGTDTEPPSKYHMPNMFKNAEHIDFYRVMDMFRIGRERMPGDSAVEHALKKLLIPGERGVKDREKDIQEAIHSLQEALEVTKELQNDNN